MKREKITKCGFCDEGRLPATFMDPNGRECPYCDGKGNIVTEEKAAPPFLPKSKDKDRR